MRLHMSHLTCEDEVKLLGEILLLPQLADLERGEFILPPTALVVARRVRHLSFRSAAQTVCGATPGTHLRDGGEVYIHVCA